MFEGMEQIAAPEDAVDEDGLRRVGWAELAAAISLSRNLRKEDRGLLSGVGPSFDRTDQKEERGVNLSSLASRKASGDTKGFSAEEPPRRHRENLSLIHI